MFDRNGAQQFTLRWMMTWGCMVQGSLRGWRSYEHARVGLQSAAGYEEGKALPVSW